MDRSRKWPYSHCRTFLALFETLLQLLLLSLLDWCISNLSIFHDSFPVTALDPLGPNYTWRGAAGVQISEAGRFYGKGMRIDYAMVSESILSAVKSVQILGNCSSRRWIRTWHLRSLSQFVSFVYELQQ